MARSRNIKPSFFTNDELAECPSLARLLFIGLWTIADREGRLEDRPKKIKAEVLPYDDCDCDEFLDLLEKRGFIIRYEHEGMKYIQVVSFNKHQNPHQKENASVIPSPYLSDASPVLAPDKPGLNPLPLSPIPHTETPTPLTAGSLNGSFGKERKFDIKIYLDDRVLNDCRKAAPQWDIYHLAGIYNENINGGREQPKIPAKAFPAWCGAYTKGKPP